MTSLRNIIQRTLFLSALFGFAVVTASWAQERLPDPVPQEARAAILEAFKEYSKHIARGRGRDGRPEDLGIRSLEDG